MKTLTRYFHQLCAIYTFAVLLLLLINAALGSSMSSTTLHAASFLRLFLFAAIFAAANLQLVSLAYSFALRVAVHCVATLIGAYGVLYLPIDSGAASSRLMMFFLMLVVYWVGMAVYLSIHFTRARHADRQDSATTSKNKKAEQTPYRSLFGGKDGENN